MNMRAEFVPCSFSPLLGLDFLPVTSLHVMILVLKQTFSTKVFVIANIRLSALCLYMFRKSKHWENLFFCGRFNCISWLRILDMSKKGNFMHVECISHYLEMFLSCLVGKSGNLFISKRVRGSLRTVYD